MNCHEFDLNVLGLARNQIVDATARESSLAHAASCVRCANRLAAEKALAAGVHVVMTEIGRKEAPARIEAALLAAFHEQVSAVASPVVVPMPLRVGNSSQGKLWKLAAAAIILILISLLAIFRLRLESPSQGGGVQPELSAAVIPPKDRSKPIEQTGVTESGLMKPRPHARMRQRVSRQKSNEPEMVTEFYPLMDGEDLDDLEGLQAVQVVRVELPASALRAAGLQVGPEMGTGPVKADVVLGYDGLARAIRFVQ